MINYEQVKLYQDSPYCLPRYKDIDTDELYKSVSTDFALKTQLNFFLNTIRPKADTVAHIKKDKQHKEQHQVVINSKNIFANDVDESILKENELKVRRLFMQELEQGCSSCRRASLIRKYSNMLRQLNIASQQKEQTEE